MSTSERAPGVLIVGASVAGATVAESLRAAGFDGTVTLVGRERHAPYNRPPLTKQVLAGEWTLGEATIHDDSALQRLHIDHRPGETALALDLAARVVTTTRATVPFERLVIATGASPRSLPALSGVSGAFSVRTIDDVLALRDRLRPGAHVAVIGAGVLGCEAATAARKAGCRVTMLCRGTGPSIAHGVDLLTDALAALLEDNGVELHRTVEVESVETGEGGIRIRSTDGAVRTADLVVEAIGCAPETAWLTGNGLDLSDGVLCDANGQAAEGVYAVGDVARWTNPSRGTAVRIEHQLAAIEQAHAVAAHLVHGRDSGPIVPFFWTELFGTRILIHGTLDPDAPLEVLAGSIESRKFLAASVRDGETVALVAWNMPRELRQERARMLAGAAPR